MTKEPIHIEQLISTPGRGFTGIIILLYYYPVRCATRHRASSMILFQLGGSDRVHGPLQFFAFWIFEF